MSQRLQALVMLLVMGLVLPRAGASWAWCLHEQRVVAPGEACSAAALSTEHRGCCCDSRESRPGCMVEAGKFLPDGVATVGVSLPPPLLVCLSQLPGRHWQPGVPSMPAACPVIPRAPPTGACPRFLWLGVVRC